ncbi:hypothetical protein LguiA_028196 [Lonicera macranthoides]
MRGREEFGDKSLVFVEFEPPSGWTEDPTSHYLLVDLPEFKMEEVKLQVDNQDQIIVSGERKVAENKYARFEQKFRVPENSDIANVTGKFEGELLYVTVPKKKIQKESGEGNINDTAEKAAGENVGTQIVPNEEGKSLSEIVDTNEIEKWRIRGNWVVKSVIEKLKKRKGILLTAVLAFSLGVFVSQKLKSNEHG